MRSAIAGHGPFTRTGWEWAKGFVFVSLEDETGGRAGARNHTAPAFAIHQFDFREQVGNDGERTLIHLIK